MSHAENDMKMSQSPNNKGTATFIELKFYFRFNLVTKLTSQDPVR